MQHALELKGIRKRYGKRVALDGLDLRVSRGSVTGMVGSNGAGKTTTIGVITGITRPRAGTIDLLGDGPFDPMKHAGRVSLMPQDSHMPPHARVSELLMFYATLQGVSVREARSCTTEVLEWVHLSDRTDSAIRTLSHGMRRRVAIAQAFVGKPELILLDEPLSGLDPKEVVNIRTLLRRRNTGQTILVSSHNLHEIERICDHVAFIENGKTIRQDSMDAVTGRREVVQYNLKPGTLPLEKMRKELPGILLEPGEDGSSLVCRFLETEHGLEDINRTVLQCLLEAGIGIIDIRRGSELEKAYLKQQEGGKKGP